MAAAWSRTSSSTNALEKSSPTCKQAENEMQEPRMEHGGNTDTEKGKRRSGKGFDRSRRLSASFLIRVSSVFPPWLLFFHLHLANVWYDGLGLWEKTVLP